MTNKNIFVSSKKPSTIIGRPLAIGQFTMDDTRGKFGHFIGYAEIGDKSYKVFIAAKQLEDICHDLRVGVSCTIETRLKYKRKINIYETFEKFIIERLVPKNLKEKIAQEAGMFDIRNN